MSDKIEPKAGKRLSDDSAAYEQAQTQGLQADDPLAAIKALRLGQLAGCRLKSEDEMQAMRDELESRETDEAASKE